MHLLLVLLNKPNLLKSACIYHKSFGCCFPDFWKGVTSSLRAKIEVPMDVRSSVLKITTKVLGNGCSQPVERMQVTNWTGPVSWVLNARKVYANDYFFLVNCEESFTRNNIFIFVIRFLWRVLNSVNAWFMAILVHNSFSYIDYIYYSFYFIQERLTPVLN